MFPGPFDNGGHHLIAMVGTVLFLVGLAIAIAIGVTVLVRLVRQDPDQPLGAFVTGDSGPATWWRRVTSQPDPALAELRLRYARGEVTQEEFLIRAYDLGGTPCYVPPPTPGHISPHADMANTAGSAGI